jgi:membrane protein
VPATHRRTPRVRTGARRAWIRAAAGFGLVGRALGRGSINFYNSDDLTYAASVAYYALLSVFPFFLLLFSILGLVMTSRASRHAAVLAFLLRAFPTHIDFLSAQLDALQKMRVRVGVGGAVALVWAALGFFSAISSAVNHAWRVETPRSYLRHKLFSFFMLLAAGLMLMIVLLLGSMFQIGQDTWYAELALRVPALGVLGSFFFRYAAFFLFIVIVGLILYFVPNAAVRLRDVWPGAILTGLLWQIALEGFSFYMRDMSRFSLIHGSVAAVVVFLVWVYTSSVILLYGVEFTATYARLRRGRPDEGPAS